MSKDTFQLYALRNLWRKETKNYAMMQLQLKTQDKKIKELEEENVMLQDLMANLPPERKKLGSLVAKLLWKATDSPTIAESVLTGKNKLLLLFDLMLRNFRQYSDLEHLFQQDDHELEHIVSLVGFLVNITELKKGAELVQNDENGCKVIEQLIIFLQQIDTVIPQTENQNSLKTILLKVLHNVSLDTTGFEILKKNFGFVDSLCKDILVPTQNQWRLLELGLVRSLLNHFDCSVYKRIQATLSHSKLFELSKDSCDSELVMIVNSILDQYKDLSDYFDFDGILSSNVATVENNK
ncbi:hypothetical protein WDU94_005095 [Cyamophila willieti]